MLRDVIPQVHFVGTFKEAAQYLHSKDTVTIFGVQTMRGAQAVHEQPFCGHSAFVVS